MSRFLKYTGILIFSVMVFIMGTNRLLRSWVDSILFKRRADQEHLIKTSETVVWKVGETEQEIPRAGSEGKLKLYRPEEVKKRLPDAHILGAMKSGTTTLHIFLGVHPDIAIPPVSSPIFFVGSYQKGIEWYRAHMPLSKPGQITIGKPGGLGAYDPEVPERIYNVNRNMKLILILRDPVLRTISHFTRNLELFPLWSNVTLEDVIFHQNRPREIDPDSPIIRKSLYHNCLVRFLPWFPLKNILLLDSDIFVKDPLIELGKAERFLGLSHKLNSKLIFYNEARGFYCYRKSGITECMPPNKGRKHVEVSEDTMRTLRQFFRPYNEQFFQLVNRTFNWL